MEILRRVGEEGVEENTGLGLGDKEGDNREDSSSLEDRLAGVDLGRAVMMNYVCVS